MCCFVAAPVLQPKKNARHSESDTTEQIRCLAGVTKYRRDETKYGRENEKKSEKIKDVHLAKKIKDVHSSCKGDLVKKDKRRLSTMGKTWKDARVAARSRVKECVGTPSGLVTPFDVRVQKYDTKHGTRCVTVNVTSACPHLLGITSL